MKALFITGTGTDIGKTYVSAAVARYMTGKHLNTGYYKAAVSGAPSIEASDAGYVRDHGGIVQETSTLLSYLYARPLSPHLAARIEGNPASLESIKSAFGSLASTFDYVLTEGAGGIVCPVAYEDGCRLFYSDIIRALGAGVAVVADAGLGTINCCVLTAEYLKAHGIACHGFILNRYDETSLMHTDNLKMVEELTGLPVLATLAAGAEDLKLRARPLEEYFDAV